MIKLVRTNSDDESFIDLVKLLDDELAKRDGDDHSFYAQFNNIDVIKHAIVAFENDQPVGCGAIKQYDDQTMEVKRMFTLPESRGKGVASKILTALEIWAAELAFKKCILETGKRQPEAIQLYTKKGYQPIENFGQYAGIENSVCFEKELI